jgi:hypothetical protein
MHLICMQLMVHIRWCNLHSENLPVYYDLANIGFGSKELRRLLQTILEITNSNRTSMTIN